MESTPNSRDSAWFDDLYSNALESATEFSGSYLDHSFAEITVRLNAIRLGSKPALSRAVTEGQLIQLQHLLPELEYSDAGDPQLGGTQDLSYEGEKPSASRNKREQHPSELDQLDYSELYEELEYEDWRYAQLTPSDRDDTETTVSQMIKALGNSDTDAQHGAPLPLCDVEERFTIEDTLPASRESTSATVIESSNAGHFTLVDDTALACAANSDVLDANLALQDEPQTATVFSEAVVHEESELLFEAVNDDEYEQAERSHAFQASDDSTQEEHDNRVSRISNEPAPMALQAGSNLLQVDPASIAQALVEMYLENERILNVQKEERLAAQARQKRQRGLIASIAAAIFVIACGALLIFINYDDIEANAATVAAAGSTIPPAAEPAALVPYQTVNTYLPASTGQTISGEVRTDLSAPTHGEADGAHPADQVGANEFNYYDEALYEPDSFADADTDYYPEAVDDSAVVVEQRDSGASLHEKAYAQWHNGDVDAAKKSYQEILANNAEDTEALVGLGSMAQRSGNNVAAVDYLVRAVKTKPDHAYALAALASLSTTANRAQLESDLMSLAKSNPNVAELPFILGNWYARDKRWADAQKAYFDAFNRNTHNADYAYNLAIALDQIGKSATARSYYRKAIALAPGANTHFDIEKARKRANQLEKAGSRYVK